MTRYALVFICGLGLVALALASLVGTLALQVVLSFPLVP